MSHSLKFCWPLGSSVLSVASGQIPAGCSAVDDVSFHWKVAGKSGFLCYSLTQGLVDAFASVFLIFFLEGFLGVVVNQEYARRL